MDLLRTNADLRAFSPAGCVLSPTMGALHAGHAALIAQGVREARARGRRALVTVFVNPTQFNDPADLAAYPQTLDDDLSICKQAGADAVYAPARSEVYPPGTEVERPSLPPVATEPGLEDAHRPGHFEGVCQVVLRLFRLCEPSAAVFGEKDWQQLQVVRAMSAQEATGVEILSAATVREADGLAMSSRNARLDGAARARARSLAQALSAGGAEQDPGLAEAAMRRVLDGAGVRVEYAVVREAVSLRPVAGGASGEGSAYRALVAAWSGGVRLIDNAAWPSP